MWCGGVFEVRRGSRVFQDSDIEGEMLMDLGEEKTFCVSCTDKLIMVSSSSYFISFSFVRSVAITATTIL